MTDQNRIIELQDELTHIREYLRQIIVERDEWRQRYLEMKHRYERNVHGKQVQE